MIQHQHESSIIKLPVIVDVIYHFGSQLLTAEALIALQAPSHGHFHFLKKQVNLFAVRVANKTATKTIQGIPFYFFKGKVSKL
jgi:hypothetical protein